MGCGVLYDEAAAQIACVWPPRTAQNLPLSTWHETQDNAHHRDAGGSQHASKAFI